MNVRLFVFIIVRCDLYLRTNNNVHLYDMMSFIIISTRKYTSRTHSGQHVYLFLFFHKTIAMKAEKL